jgi:hypothetical protein
MDVGSVTPGVSHVRALQLLDPPRICARRTSASPNHRASGWTFAAIQPVAVGVSGVPVGVRGNLEDAVPFWEEIP